MKETAPEEYKTTARTPKERHTDLSREESLKTNGGMALFGYLLDNDPKKAAMAIEQLLNQEKKDEPHFYIDIFYSNHVTPKDIEGLIERIKTTDVFVPESIRWDEKFLSDIQGVTEGKLTPREFFQTKPSPKNMFAESLWDALIYGLHETDKTIVIFDLPKNHPLIEAISEVSEKLSVDENVEFPDLISSFRNNLKQFAKLQKEREDYMLKSLEQFREKVRNGAFPKLTGKKEIKILLFLGAVHTRIYHELKKKGDDTQRTFPIMPFQFGHYGEEIIRRFLFGKEVSDDLIAHTILWGAIFRALNKRIQRISEDTYKNKLFIKKLVDAFRIEDIRDVFDTRQKEGEEVSGDASNRIEKRIFDFIEKKGITIPHSEAELNALMGKK